jgi:phosphodiesterase/alkaline phosphatase D-like protein
MNLKRRDFLIGGGLGAIALIAAQYAQAIVDWLGLPLFLLPAMPAVGLEPALIPEPDPPDLILRFAITADAGSGDYNQYQVARAMTRYYQQHPFPLVLLAGDNIYTNGEVWKLGRVFERPYQGLLDAKVRFQACLGNHDIRTNNGEGQLGYAPFNMPGRYYTFEQPSVQFFVLDTNDNADWVLQLSWLEQELSQSTAPWKVVYGHHPLYSCGRYGNSPNLIQKLAPLFARYGVQLYINGHEHNYQRSQPLQGTTYLICGNGGARLYPVEMRDWVAMADSRHGFSVVEVYGDRLQIQAIDTQGQVFDQCLIKG